MSLLASATLSELIRPVPVLGLEQTCRQALRIMFDHPEAKCMVFCGKDGEPAGLLMSDRFLLQATGKRGTGLFYREPAFRLAQHKPLILDIDTPAEIAARLALDRPAAFRHDDVLVTENGKWAGAASVSDLVQALGGSSAV